MKTILTMLSFLSICFASSAADRTTQMDDIREAVFRYQFPKNVRDDSIVLFISVYDAHTKKSSDPSPELMKRFAKHRPRVAEASKAANDPKEGVTDPQTGMRGVIWEVGAITWRSDDAVEVDGGYSAGILAGSCNTYFVRKKNGRWFVEGERLDGISLLLPASTRAV